MFKQLLSIGSAFDTYMTNRGRVEARRILLSQDDKTLEDIGIDRHELISGVKYWPWDGSVTLQQSKQDTTTQAQAIRELNNYSDRELHDLGINRGMIADAVANGRSGIESVEQTEQVTNDTRRQAA